MGAIGFFPELCSWILIDPLVQRIRDRGDMRFAHYTTLDAARSILQGRKLWLRNVRLMNDTSEIVYAGDCLARQFLANTSPALAFWDIVDRGTKGRAAELKTVLTDTVAVLGDATFISSVGEHPDDEDRFGRLSMWRSYGRPVGVAFVVNSRFVEASTNALATFSFPVSYWDDSTLAQHVAQVAQDFEDCRNKITTWDEPDAIYSQVLEGLVTLAMSIKHPGFREEREWRIAYRPDYESSPLMKRTHVAVRGVQQDIFELPLEHSAKSGEAPISPSDLIDRIVVGPTIDAEEVRQILINDLEGAGVADAAVKVTCSSIPYREV